MTVDTDGLASLGHMDDQTPYSFVHNLILCAADVRGLGAVCRHLVFAGLRLSLPPQSITDLHTEGASIDYLKPGDFKVGDTIFFVEAVVGADTYASCRDAVSHGSLATVLVPASQLALARSDADRWTLRDITVESVETFVSQQIEFASGFRKRELRSALRQLVENYNFAMTFSESEAVTRRTTARPT